MTLDYTVPVSDVEHATQIWAWDGRTIHCLSLCTFTTRPDNALSVPWLVDSAGMVVHPWEVTLWRWPPDAEAALRRGGYLSERLDQTELWCNCHD